MVSSGRTRRGPAALGSSVIFVLAVGIVWANPDGGPKTFGEWFVGGAAKLVNAAASAPLQSAIKSGGFTPDEKARFSAKVEEVVTAADKGRIPAMRGSRILAELLASKIWLVDTVKSLVPLYVNRAQVPDAEKEAMRNEINRYALAAWHDALDWNAQEELWMMVANRSATGTTGLSWVDPEAERANRADRAGGKERDVFREMEEDQKLTVEQRHKKTLARLHEDMDEKKTKKDPFKHYRLKLHVTAGELRKLTDAMRAQSDRASVPAHPAPVDAVGDTLRSIDLILSGKAGPEVDEKMVAKGIGLFLGAVEDANEKKARGNATPHPPPAAPGSTSTPATRKTTATPNTPQAP